MVFMIIVNIFDLFFKNILILGICMSYSIGVR